MDLLRQIVASPRARHPEANLDLCYVTENIIATSGPGKSYPQVAYRTPLKDLVKFLNSKHKDNWAIWEFRAEGTGYPDEEVYGRIRHYPWPDHHPPPFALVPLIMGSMRNWLKDNSAKGRVAVVHCKAGKGRSGTISCSYLISEEGWTAADAMQRFTDRRMRPGFGNGISIPSQLRWITYVDRWTKSGKKPYVDRSVEIVEVHVWGLRDGVKIAVEGYVDEGKVIKSFHTFKKEERRIVRGCLHKDTGFADAAMEMMGKNKVEDTADAEKQVKQAEKAEKEAERLPSHDDRGGDDIVFTPSERIILPSFDINMDFERRNKSKYGGFTMVTSVAHVWFNTYFEGNGPEQGGKPDDSGVFSIDFEAMDGIKGSSRKGTKCFDKLQVIWKAVQVDDKPDVTITEPSRSTADIPQARPADWRGGTDEQSNDFEKKLGLRAANSDSADVSRASSVNTEDKSENDNVKDELETVQATGPDGKVLNGPVAERQTGATSTQIKSSSTTYSSTNTATRTAVVSHTDGASKRGTSSGNGHLSPAELRVDKNELGKHHEHNIGHMKLTKNTETSS